MCITVEKKFEKVENWKFKLALKFLKKSWKSRKIRKSLFFKMVDFWHSFCNLYFVFCIFVFLSFCLFVFLPFLSLPRSGSPSPQERLTSNSRVVIDHRNRHHHHQIGNHYKSRPKNQFSRNLLKTMLDFFFCQAQLCTNVYYRENFFRKSWKMKI